MTTKAEAMKLRVMKTEHFNNQDEETCEDHPCISRRLPQEEYIKNQRLQPGYKLSEPIDHFAFSKSARTFVYF